MDIQSVNSATFASHGAGGASSQSTHISSSQSVTSTGLGSSTSAFTSSGSTDFSMLSESTATSEPLQALATLLLAVALLEAMSGEEDENDSGKAAGMLALAGALFSGGESTFISMSSTSISSGGYDAGGAAVAGGQAPAQIDTVA